jgi:hypothetical protein
VRVIVTRPRAQAGPLVERLEELGCEVVECPLIEIEPLGDEPIDASAYEWLIVTSPNGADEIARRLVGTRPKVAAVGPGTAERLREHGIEPAFVPRVSSQDGLLAEFPRPQGRVLFAAAETGRGSSGRRRRPTATSSCSRPARPRAPSPGSASTSRRSRSARRRPRWRRSSACASSPRRRRTTSTGSSRRSLG